LLVQLLAVAAVHGEPFSIVDRHAPLLQYGVEPEHCPSLVHAFAQLVPAALHESGLLQVTVVGGGQLPDPLQPAASVTVPPVQLSARHDVALPGYVQPSVLVGAQVPAHAVPSPSHAARPPCGAPETCAHVPPASGTSHASH
jgi:hypothetical protein